MMRALLLLPLLGLTLAGCIPMMPEPTPAPLADLSPCGGNALYTFVGQPSAALPDHGGWSTLRIIKPGMMVTMDYSATRLNARVDGQGRILELTCG